MSGAAELDFRDLARAVGTVTRFAAGDPVFLEGETPRYMYVVLRGAVEISSRGKIIETVHAGQALGIISLLDGEKRTATARAREESELAVLDRRRFRQMIGRMPDFAWYVMAEMAHRLRTTNAAL